MNLPFRVEETKLYLIGFPRQESLFQVPQKERAWRVLHQRCRVELEGILDPFPKNFSERSAKSSSREYHRPLDGGFSNLADHCEASTFCCGHCSQEAFCTLPRLAEWRPS